MLSAYEKQRSLGDRLVRHYGVAAALGDLDAFLTLVQDNFLRGVHTAYLGALLRAMKKELKTQQRMAEALGLRDRSSISHMMKSGTMDGVRFTAALNRFRGLIEFPSREMATLYGFAHATAYIKARALDDKNIEGSMYPQDFSYLVGVLASREWDAAIRSPRPEEARRVAERIVCERRLAEEPPGARRRARPEHYVFMLRELSSSWGDFAVIALWAIPECIPEGEDGEATL